MASKPSAFTGELAVRNSAFKPTRAYRLDVSRIQSFEDVRRIFEVLDLRYVAYADPDRVKEAGAEHLFIPEEREPK